MQTEEVAHQESNQHLKLEGTSMMKYFHEFIKQHLITEIEKVKLNCVDTRDMGDHGLNAFCCFTVISQYYLLFMYMEKISKNLLTSHKINHFFPRTRDYTNSERHIKSWFLNGTEQK